MSSEAKTRMVGPESARAWELHIANCTMQIEKRRGRTGVSLPFFCRFFAVSSLFNMQYAMCNLQFSRPPRTFGTHWNLFLVHSVAIRTRSEATGTRLEATGTRAPPLSKLQVIDIKHVTNFRPPNFRLFRFSLVKFCIETLLRAALFAPPVSRSVASSSFSFASPCHGVVPTKPDWWPWLPYRSAAYRPGGRSSCSMLEVERWTLEVRRFFTDERPTSNFQPRTRSLPEAQRVPPYLPVVNRFHSIFL
jgi:hypothetical protein